MIGIWQERTLVLLRKAYENIPPAKAAEYLGKAPENVVSGIFTTILGVLTVLELEEAGWTYNDDTRLLYPPAKLQTCIPAFS